MGSPELRVDGGEFFRQQAVAGHGKEDPRLPQLKYQKNRSVGDNGAEGYDAHKQISPFFDIRVLKRQRQGFRLLSGQHLYQRSVGDDSGKHRGNQYVYKCAQDQ